MRLALCLALLLVTSAAFAQPASPDAPVDLTPSASSLAARVVPAPGAGVQRCASSSPALANVDAGMRLAFLRGRMRDEVAGAQRWTGLFGAGFGVLALGQLGLAQTAIDRKRVDNYVSVPALLIGYVSVNTSVVHSVATDPYANAKVPASEEELCHAVAEAEATLQRYADGEALGTSVLAHVANVVVNTALLLVLGLAYKHWAVGGLDFGVGMVIGEALLLTQPRGLVKANSDYRAATF